MARRKVVAKRRAARRELIDAGTDKRYVRRHALGASFVESDDAGRPRAQERRRRTKRDQGGRGDR
ncbi:MAG: hypothetical protein KF889_06940 [Alphaproteobacteria bacterium]|nr:hypothetical protein [Alphaproteobacteria bacterium]MCW5740556.1 hypothetical protein [Alphaproteobacteria bacterium]